MEAVRVQAKMPGSDVWTWPAFRCNTDGCVRLFESRGYLSISDGIADPNGRTFIGCEDGTMFIERIEANLLIWRCSRIGCQRSRKTDRTFRPVDD